MKASFLVLFVLSLGIVSISQGADRAADKAPAAGVDLSQLEKELAADKTALETRLRNDQQLQQKLLYMEAAAVAGLALKALENYPSPQVLLLLTYKYSTARSQARFLKADQAKALHSQWFADLQKADKLMEPLRKDPAADERLKHAFEQLDQNLALAALEAGDLPTARAKAQLALKNNTNKQDWNYGNLLHAGHSVLGRAALKDGDKAAARKHLIAAGNTPGSPQLNSFGPDFTFAREMIEAGEKEAVLEYLELVGKFWGIVQPRLANNPNSVKVAERNAAQLKKWQEEIAAGAIPNDPKWK